MDFTEDLHGILNKRELKEMHHVASFKKYLHRHDHTPFPTAHILTFQNCVILTLQIYHAV